VPNDAATVIAVNVVHALIPDVRGELDRTAIDKRPVTGRVAVGPLGVDGDDQYDKQHHGGEEQAVYAYAREDAEWWARELGYEVPPGRFGENLSTRGVDITGAVIGEQWRVGDDGLLLEVSGARVPCATFQGWMDEPHWVRRFTDRCTPGAYLRVLTPGTVAAGDPIEIVHRPAHGVTVGDVLVIRRTDGDRLLTALDHPAVRGKLADAIRRDLSARARSA
jgi:MOSC domain-containing protein YiiM